MAAAARGEVSSDGARAHVGRPRVVVYDLSDHVVDYEEAWAWQRALLDRAATAADGAGPRGSAQALLLLQHPPVYTLGAGASTENLRFPPDSPPIPLFRTERGGEVTYHGPGQLVMYPILDLQVLKPDLHWYLRQLEQVVIEALESVSGLQGERLEGLTGVWVGGAKVAAIGVRAKRWVSYHGLALNVVTDLSPFGRIVPCGIADRAVTSVERLLAERQRQEDPFAPPPAAEGGPRANMVVDGEGGEEMVVPLAEAHQEDLHRMLVRAGATPLTLPEGAPSGRADTPAADDPFVDDPFAPPRLPAADGAAGDAAAHQSDAAVGAEAGGRRSTYAQGQDASHKLTSAARATVSDSASNAYVGTGTSSGAGYGSEGGLSGGGGSLAIRGEWNEGERLLLREYSCALLEAFSEVFGVELVQGNPSELSGLVGRRQ